MPQKMSAHSNYPATPRVGNSGMGTEAWGKEEGVFTSSIMHVCAI